MKDEKVDSPSSFLILNAYLSSEAAERRCATPAAIKLLDTFAGLRRGLAS
jgi:hypothetical protein